MDQRIEERVTNALIGLPASEVIACLDAVRFVLTEPSVPSGGELEILCQSINLYGKRIDPWQRSLILKQP